MFLVSRRSKLYDILLCSSPTGPVWPGRERAKEKAAEQAELDRQMEEQRIEEEVGELCFLFCCILRVHKIRQMKND